jgi:type IV secretion system protein VirD4
MPYNRNEFLRGKPGKKSRRLRFDLFNLALPLLLFLAGLFLFAQNYALWTGYNPVYTGEPLFLSGFALPLTAPHLAPGSTPAAPVYSGSAADAGPLEVLSAGRDVRVVYPVYNPGLCFLYILAHPFDAKVQTAFYKGIIPFLISALAALLLFFIISALRGRHDKGEKLYGSARWADEKDLARFGLCQENGVVLAQQRKALVDFAVNPANASVSLKLRRAAPLLCHSGGTNTLMIAPTRSGKGVSSVIPTCLSFPQSMIIYDPKGELWQATAGFRSQFSHVLKFSPLSYDTLRFNPLEEIELDEQAFADTGLILNNMFGDSGAKGGDDNTAFFNNSAKDFLTGLILHVLSCGFYTSESKNLAGILAILSQAAAQTSDALGNEVGAADALLHEMLDYPHFDKSGRECAYLHEIVCGAANRSLGQNAKVRQDVFSTIFSKMALFQDPYIRYVTGASDFRLDDFYDSASPLSLYLTVPWSDIGRIAPVFKVLINFILNKFSRGEAGYSSGGSGGSGGKRLKNRILFLLDEFPTLGHFPFIAQSMGILAGYGITFYIIVQALNQIVDIYGANHSFLDNCKTVCLFAPGKLEDAKMFSAMIGQESVVKESISSSGYRFSLALNNLNASSQEVGRNLINPDELMKLPPSDAVIYNQGMPPYMAKKLVYYQDARFKRKTQYKAPQTRLELLREVAGLPSFAESRTRRREERARGDA